MEVRETMQILVILEKGNKGEENYSCYSPDVPGCITVGDTIEDTLIYMKEALELHFEGMIEDGASLPSFRSVENIAKEVSFDQGDILASVEIEIVSSEAAA